MVKDARVFVDARASNESTASAEMTVYASVMEAQLRLLYEAEHPTAYRFRYGLLAFDLFTILFIVGTSFLDRTPIIALLDILLGLAILADFVARLLISPERLRCLLQFTTWADIVANSEEPLIRRLTLPRVLLVRSRNLPARQWIRDERRVSASRGATKRTKQAQRTMD